MAKSRRTLYPLVQVVETSSVLTLGVMADFSLFWDPYKTSTYNALFNFIIGNRGGGKSYGAKHFVIKRFIERNEQFVYVRRFDKEMTAVADKFFADISDEYPDKELDYKNGGYFVN